MPISSFGVLFFFVSISEGSTLCLGLDYIWYPQLYALLLYNNLRKETNNQFYITYTYNYNNFPKNWYLLWMDNVHLILTVYDLHRLTHVLLQCHHQNPLMSGHFCLHWLLHQVALYLSSMWYMQPHYHLQGYTEGRLWPWPLAQHQVFVLTDHLEVALLLLLL